MKPNGFHFNFTVSFLQSSNAFLFNQHKRLLSKIFDVLIVRNSMENNTRRDNFQLFPSWNRGDTTEKNSVLYQQVEINGCSSDVWINHCQFRECSQPSFHSLLHEKKVMGVMFISSLTLCMVSMSLSWSLKSVNVGLASGSFCQQLVMIWYLKFI